MLEEGTRGASTRREALRRGGGLALLAAGGSIFPAATSAAADTLTTAPKAKGVLNFLGYEGDDFPPVYKKWEDASGIKFRASYINDDSELFQKLKSGSVSADLISCTLPWGPSLIEAGIVTPIDPAKLPNLAHVWPFFKAAQRGFFKNGQGKWVTIPAYWGSIGIAWDKTVVPRVSSWKDILDPAFTGKIALVDFPTLHLLVAAQVKRFDTAKMSKADLQAFKDFMLPIVKQAKTVTGSFGDLISLLGSKEVAAVFPAYTFISGGAQAKGNKDVKLNLRLKEGSPLVAEMYAIPPTAKNVDAAYAFLDQSLSPGVAAKVAAAQGAITTVSNAVGRLDPATKALYPYGSLSTFLAKSKLMANPPQRSSKYVTSSQIADAWTEIKQQAGK